MPVVFPLDEDDLPSVNACVTGGVLGGAATVILTNLILNRMFLSRTRER
jgi:hypothetical protein